jgi:hypothetical protein
MIYQLIGSHQSEIDLPEGIAVFSSFPLKEATEYFSNILHLFNIQI